MKINNNLEVKRGMICDTVDGSFMFLGRDGNLFKVREVSFDENGFVKRSKAGMGFHVWTEREVIRQRWC